MFSAIYIYTFKKTDNVPIRLVITSIISIKHVLKFDTKYQDASL